MDEKSSKRVKEIYAVLFLALGVLLLLSMLSYHPEDPSFNRYLSEPIPPHNLIGVWGSYSADAIFQLLGLAAFLLPLFLFVIAAKFIQHHPPSIHPGISSSLTLTFLAAVAGLSDLLFHGIKVNNIQAGGLLGGVLAKLLNHYFNPLGASLLLIIMALIPLLFLSDLPLLTLVKKIVFPFLWAGRLIAGIIRPPN